MKTHIKLFVTAALIAFIGISNSNAALNMYLKIEGNGKSKIVQIKCPDGSCKTSVDGLTPGKYTITLCNSTGTAMKVKEKGNRTKCTSNLRYYQNELVSPRDAASGLPTGKRQYSPLIIRKEIDADRKFVATADVTGDGITFDKIDWTWSDGSISAEDDWEAPLK
jgi:hypothetical protein